MKQLEVPIMGQAYVLACPDGSEERMIEAVQRVDSAMCKIRDAGKVRARDRIAVLAAINLAFDLSDKLAAASPQLGAPNADDRARLAALIQRLDESLSSDDQLI